MGSKKVCPRNRSRMSLVAFLFWFIKFSFAARLRQVPRCRPANRRNVSKERRTPVHKPVFDRLMMSTDVDGALR